jgi:hypothetical protein
MKMRYIDMTPAQREEAYADNAQAAYIHAHGFAMRPGYTSADREAERHWNKVVRECNFILRCARSRGDEWAKKIRT